MVDDSTGKLGAGQETEGLPLSPKDIRDWERVQAVREQFHKGFTTTTDACKAANVPRRSYYAALKNPYVQGMVLEQMDALNQATIAVLERGWVPALKNMAALAQSASSKEAVQAARFIADLKRDLEKQTAGHRATGESAAAKAVKSFLGGKQVRLSETTVHREVAVNEGELSGGKLAQAGDVVDGQSRRLIE